MTKGRAREGREGVEREEEQQNRIPYPFFSQTEFLRENMSTNTNNNYTIVMAGLIRKKKTDCSSSIKKHVNIF